VVDCLFAVGPRSVLQVGGVRNRLGNLGGLPGIDSPRDHRIQIVHVDFDGIVIDRVLVARGSLPLRLSALPLLARRDVLAALEVLVGLSSGVT